MNTNVREVNIPATHGLLIFMGWSLKDVDKNGQKYNILYILNLGNSEFHRLFKILGNYLLIHNLGQTTPSHCGPFVLREGVSLFYF